MTSVAFAVQARSMRVRGATQIRHARPARPGYTRGRHARPAARRATTWELRSFVGASAAIAVAFALALTYLAGSTGVASVSYDAQRLQAKRDELRRQNALLELDLARLDSPARIEAEAKRLGLVRIAFVPVVPADPLAARR